MPSAVPSPLKPPRECPQAGSSKPFLAAASQTDPHLLCVPALRPPAPASGSLDERSGPAQSGNWFHFPCPFGCPKWLDQGMKLSPLAAWLPLLLPLVPTSALPFTEHLLGARHFTHTLLVCLHHNPMGQGLSSPFSPEKKCIHMLEGTPQVHDSTGTRTPASCTPALWPA